MGSQHSKSESLTIGATTSTSQKNESEPHKTNDKKQDRHHKKVEPNACTPAKSIDRTTSVPRLQKDKTIAEGKKDRKSKMTRRNHGPKINTQTKATTPYSAMISAHHPVTVSKGRKTRTNTQKRRCNLTVHPKRIAKPAES
jgi:hypothetical protein